MQYTSKILKIERLTPSVKKFIAEKPKNYKFVSGQHTLISINKPELKDKKKPFSISSSDKSDSLEFIIKIYNEKDESITKEFDKLKIKDELILDEAKGKIGYKGNGVFIAAGTGISPFLSIMNSLDEPDRKENLLIYLNKTHEGVILENELKRLFNKNAVFILSREKKSGYEHGHIDREFLKNKIKNFNQKFYICGPFKMVIELKKILTELGARQEDIVSEI